VENLYTRAMLAKEFESFSDLNISEHDSLTQEGTGNGGMKAFKKKTSHSMSRTSSSAAEHCPNRFTVWRSTPLASTEPIN
jgi:hypothetical protein